MADKEITVERGDPTPKKAKHKFPTEIITLPSKGHFYPKDSPLSKGELEIKYMTAKEEDILTSQSLIRKGVVLEKLLEAVIVDEDVDTNDLLLGDKNAILIATRLMAYGSAYKVSVSCPTCGRKQEESIDLGQIRTKEINLSELEKGVNLFQFVVPSSNITLEWKIVTQEVDKAIDEEVLAMKKFSKSEVSSQVTTRFRHIIQSVDGDTSVGRIKSFIENEFLSKDIRAFRDEMNKFIPDVDLTYNFVCESCNSEEELRVPIGAEFFWPS